MQRDDMLNYYKNLNCEKIILCHGSSIAKKDFKEDLELALSEVCKSTRVIIANKGIKITL